ncbi:MAG: ABC transporter ATP-binding protein, partial [Ilumatobacteraceae bacterium]
MTSHAVEVSGLWKKFRLYHEKNQYLKAAVMSGGRSRFEDFWALRDVSFEVPEGEAFGIIGSNGSGKSTLLKCLAGILTAEKGTVHTAGRVAALLELGAGFHPDLSGRENIGLNGAILGMSRTEVQSKFDDIVEFAGLEKFIDTPVKNSSSGMVVRLGFAVAINVEPEILIIDEVLAVGDEEFQQRCFQKIEQFRREGRTII